MALKTKKNEKERRFSHLQRYHRALPSKAAAMFIFPPSSKCLGLTIGGYLRVVCCFLYIIIVMLSTYVWNGLEWMFWQNRTVMLNKEP